MSRSKVIGRRVEERRVGFWPGGSLAVGSVVAVVGVVVAGIAGAQTTISTGDDLNTQIGLLNAAGEGAPTAVAFDGVGPIQAPGGSFTDIMNTFTITGATGGTTINGGGSNATFVIAPGADNAVRFEELTLTNATIQIDSGSLEYVLEDSSATFDGVISGAGDFTKQGSGTLRISGQNVFSGMTTVGGGTLIVEDIGGASTVALPGSGAVTLASGSTLTFEIDDEPIAQYGGSITSSSDTAAIRKTGNNVLRLNGANSYTSGTFVDAGTLEIVDIGTTGGPTFGASTITVASGASFALRQNDAMNPIAFSGGVAGAGTFDKFGAAAVRLGGTHTIANTTIDEGSLSLQDVVGGSGNIALQSGTTFFLRSTLADGTPSFDGTIDRAAGSSATGTYAFTINPGDDGVGTLPDDPMVQSFTGSVGPDVTTTLAGGTLRLPGAVSFGGSGIALMPADATLEFAQATDLTFSEPISGAGAVTKSGAGTLTLGGTQSYAGATTVAGGRLLLASGTTLASPSVDVQSGASFGGGGTANAVTIASGGMIAPGFSVGTLNVSSLTLEPGSVTQIEVDSPTSFDQIIVGGGGGPLTINGGTVQVILAADALSGTPIAPGSDLLAGAAVIDAGSIAGSGTLTATNPSFFFDAALDQSGNDVLLTLTRNANTFAGLATTASQSAMGAILDGVADGSIPVSGELEAVFAGLTAGANAVTIANTLDALGGEIYTLVPTIQRSLATQFGSALLRRGSARLRRARGASLMPAEYRFRAELPSGANRMTHEFGVGALDGWYEGFVQSLRLGDHTSRDVRALNGGGTFGVDYAPLRGVVAGFALGYARTTAELSGLDIDFDANTVQTGLYAGYHDEWLQLAGAFRYAWTGSSTERDVEVDAVDRTAEADLDGHQVGIHLKGLVDLPLFGTTRIQPLAGFAWDHLIGDDVNESGAGTLNLAGDGETLNSVVTTVGLRLTGSFLLDPFSSFVPYLESSFAHEFGDVERELDFRFESQPGVPVFRSRGAAAPRNTWRGSVGWDVQLSSGLVLNAGYDVDLAGDFMEHTGRIGGEFRW